MCMSAADTSRVGQAGHPMSFFLSKGGCRRCPECRAWLELRHNGYHHCCTENTRHTHTSARQGSRLACGPKALVPLRRCGCLARPLEGSHTTGCGHGPPRQTSACAPRERARSSLCPMLLQPFRRAELCKLGRPRPSVIPAQVLMPIEKPLRVPALPSGLRADLLWLQLGRATARSLVAPRPASGGGPS